MFPLKGRCSGRPDDAAVVAAEDIQRIIEDLAEHPESYLPPRYGNSPGFPNYEKESWLKYPVGKGVCFSSVWLETILGLSIFSLKKRHRLFQYNFVSYFFSTIGDGRRQ